MKWLDSALRYREGRAWMTNVALCLIGCGLVVLSRQFSTQLDHYTIGFSGLSLSSVCLYLAAIALILTQPVDRATLWIILGFALAFRVFPYLADPFLSSDIYRYVWDGIVQHAHINPYRYVPGDPALTFLQAPHQDIFDNINRRDYAHTIYPPAAQMIYWCVTLISPTIAGMKLAMIGFECVAVGALLAMLRRLGRRREEILLYAWCPLLVWEIGCAGHIDAAVFAFVCLALLFRMKGNSLLVGVFLGLAVLTKFYPLVLFPALYQRRDWKMPAVMVAMTAAMYSVYASVGWGVFGFFGGYEQEEGMNTGVRYFLLDFARSFHPLRNLSVHAFMVFCALVMGAITLWAWQHATLETCNATPRTASTPLRTTPAFLRAAMAFAFALMLLFSPHYPWYIAWLVPFIALAPNLPLLTYVVGLFYLCTTALADGSTAGAFALNERLYAAVLVAFLVQAVLRRWPLPEYLRCNPTPIAGARR